MSEEVYTLEEAEKATNILQKELRDAIESGVLPAKVSQNTGDYIIKHSDLMSYAKMVTGKKSTKQIITTKKILIIDSDYNFANIIKLELERDTRFLAKVATYGKDGTFLARSFYPNVILVEMLLPDARGDVVIESIGDLCQRYDIKTIAYYEDIEKIKKEIPNLTERLKMLNVNEFMSKSGGVKSLVAKVYELLGLDITLRQLKK